jgi:hypothetical protein
MQIAGPLPKPEYRVVYELERRRKCDSCGLRRLCRHMIRIEPTDGTFWSLHLCRVCAFEAVFGDAR